MSSIKTADFAASLLKKGFQTEETHHHMFYYMLDGKRTSVYTRISHGSKEYGDSLISMVKKQMHLTKSQFLSFVECPLTSEEYREILITNDHIRIKDD